jgi:ribosomal protein S18 acetylase RimI-like enzyme
MKSKDLKLFRKRLATARRLENPLGTIDATELFHGYHKRSNNSPSSSSELHPQLEYEWEVQFVSSLSSWQLECCLQILQDNMQALYQQSAWGWNLQEKRQEMQHDHARFILVMKKDDDDGVNSNANDSTGVTVASNAKEEKQNIVAFCHLRFDWDDDEHPTEPVLYVYELQIHSDYQRRGMGQVIMNDVIPHISRRTQLNKCMLTVFHHNDAAMQFYQQHCRFTIDASSPSQFGEPADYEILSRRLEEKS